jgi:hypothetical protein
MSTTKKMYDISKLSEYRKQIVTNLNELIKENYVNKIPSNSGVVNTQPPSKILNHIRAQSETIFGDSYIEGTDRPFGRGSGYGGKGALVNSQASSAVRIVTGRSARAPNLKDGTHVDPNFQTDAATMYLSNITDVDTNLGFCDGPLGNKKAQSTVAGTADQIRFFGYNGVQISTGMPNVKSGIPGGMTTSTGGKIERAPPIVLAAGNTDGKKPLYGLPGKFADEEVSNIQGVAKGENLQACVRELAEMLDKMMGALIRLAIYQGGFAAVLGVTIPPGIQPHHAVAAGYMVNETYASFISSLISLRLEKVFWETMYCSEGSPKNITSTNVFTS